MTHPENKQALKTDIVQSTFSDKIWMQHTDAAKTPPSYRMRQALRLCTGQWRVCANSRQPGNADANVTFDNHNKPKFTFAFASCIYVARCTNSPMGSFRNNPQHCKRTCKRNLSHLVMVQVAGCLLKLANGRCVTRGSPHAQRLAHRRTT